MFRFSASEVLFSVLHSHSGFRIPNSAFGLSDNIGSGSHRNKFFDIIVQFHAYAGGIQYGGDNPAMQNAMGSFFT